MAKSLLISGHKRIIIDATNTTKKRRNVWKYLDASIPYNLEIYEMPYSAETCIERAKKDDKDFLIPVIERMHNRYEKPTEEEGFIIPIERNEELNE